MKSLLLISILAFSFSSFVLNDAFVGDWAYEIKNTQIGDVAGIISLKKVDGQLKGVIKGGDRELNLNDIAINGNVLTSAFNYEEVLIKLSLEISDGNLKGLLVVSEGEKYSFTANKKN